jgi:hypothetical protein
MFSFDYAPCTIRLEPWTEVAATNQRTIPCLTHHVQNIIAVGCRQCARIVHGRCAMFEIPWTMTSVTGIHMTRNKAYSCELPFIVVFRIMPIENTVIVYQIRLIDHLSSSIRRLHCSRRRCSVLFWPSPPCLAKLIWAWLFPLLTSRV